MRDSADQLAAGYAAFRRYAPAVVPVAAVIGGILVDRHSRFDFAYWLLVATVAAVAWIVCFALRRYRASAICLLILLAGLGGARHHQEHDVAESIDIARYASRASIPVRVRGMVTSSPIVIIAKQEPMQAPWQQREKVMVYVRVKSLATNGGSEQVAGVVRLQVVGDKLDVEPGDEIVIDGWLARPTGPRNPGEYDFRERLLRYDVRCIVYCEDKQAVRKTGDIEWTPRRSLARLRKQADGVLKQHLQGRTHAVAAAMLLGDRTQLNGNMRDAFIESGMMHVLAISGMHVGLLAILLMLATRAVGLRSGGMAVVVLVGIVVYALLTDVRPSIVRATVVIAVLVLGRALHRRSSTLNALAIAALLILVWSPLDLFDVGAQLSFLSVLGMIVSGGWLRRQKTEESTLAELEERSLASRGFRFVGGWLLRVYVTLAGIWLFTVPLVAAKFHILSPIGLLVNVLLVPVITGLLWIGYILVFGGMLIPQIASTLAVPFSGGLEWVLSVVDWASSVKIGHRFVAGPADWWLWGYFSLLFGILLIPRFARRRVLCISSVLLWLAVGISTGLVPARRDGVRCTFLSTGHGVAVLIELPDGRTILYDAGSIGGADRATRTVQSAMWHYGHSRLDAIIISHADVDHFNGTPKLLETVPVGKLYVAKQFLDFKQESVVVLHDAAKDAGVPIELVQAGDSLSVGDDVSLRVLHPDDSEYSSDNAASIVIELTYAGRRILLTGDIEKDGLDRLTEVYRKRVDVMLSPHHGSLSANPASLGDLYQPTHIIASSGRRVSLKVLRQRFPKPIRVMSTHYSGAVTVTIRPDGEMRVGTVFVAEE